MRRGGEAAHVQADLGDDDLGGDPADAGDLIQPLGRSGERGDLRLDLGLQGAMSALAWSMRPSMVCSRKA